jgi:Tfp pilus assembly protein PilF
VGLADYYDVVYDYAPIPAREAAPKALVTAQKAIAIDDTLAEAHATLASAYAGLWNWGAAEREFKRALELDPLNLNYNDNLGGVLPGQRAIRSGR